MWEYGSKVIDEANGQNADSVFDVDGDSENFRHPDWCGHDLQPICRCGQNKMCSKGCGFGVGAIPCGCGQLNQPELKRIKD